MKVLCHLQWLAAFLACVTWVLPVHKLSAEPPVPANRSVRAVPGGATRDIALGAGGRLAGQVVDVEGSPLPQHVILIRRLPGDQTVKAVSDRTGRFVVDGLSGGVLQVTAGQSVALCRCWTDGTAPPSANRQLLLISGNSVERGQMPIGEALFSAPVLVGLIIAAAIAIPVAVHNARDKDSAS